jgi:uncharacterized protein
MLNCKEFITLADISKNMLQNPESAFILQKLTRELSENLHYHTVSHTLDVYHTAAMIASKEHICTKDTRLLLAAALYHDSGYLHHTEGHETISCRIASEVLPQFGYTETDIAQICIIISATKLPQQPHSKLEEIICDADMDYLGRDDFFEIGHRLYMELLESGAVSDEKDWNRLQINFLQHHYFTKTAQLLRNEKKEENLKILLSKAVDI